MLQKQILQIANLRFRMYELTGAGTGTGRLRRDVRDRTTKLMFSKFAILPYTYCYSFAKESLPYLMKLMHGKGPPLSGYQQPQHWQEQGKSTESVKFRGQIRSCGLRFSVAAEGRIPATKGVLEIAVENFGSSL